MTVRTFTWADLPALFELVSLVRAGGAEGPGSTELLREELAQPGLAPQENCFLYENDRELQAYYIVHPELPIGRAVLEMGLRPGHTGGGIEREVVRSAMVRAKGMGAGALHVCLPPTESRRALLEEEGFSKVRDYWTMRWRQKELSSTELPEGFSVESSRPVDVQRLTEVQNASFSGSWGFCPNTVEEVTHRAGMSICSPEGILFLAHGKDTAGYCWTCVRGDSGSLIGVIWMIGIAPAYRGRGLSKPILLAGMDYLNSRGVKTIRLDVDGDNSPAIGLYTSVGFVKVGEDHWFEAPLSEP